VTALLGVVERLRGKHLSPSPAVTGRAAATGGGPSASAARHPERFGALRGSARVRGDVEAPVEDAEQWTFDAKNLGV
jgi:hypothetical protein